MKDITFLGVFDLNWYGNGTVCSGHRTSLANSTVAPLSPTHTLTLCLPNFVQSQFQLYLNQDLRSVILQPFQLTVTSTVNRCVVLLKTLGIISTGAFTREERAVILPPDPQRTSREMVRQTTL